MQSAPLIPAISSRRYTPLPDRGEEAVGAVAVRPQAQVLTLHELFGLLDTSGLQGLQRWQRLKIGMFSAESGRNLLVFSF